MSTVRGQLTQIFEIAVKALYVRSEQTVVFYFKRSSVRLEKATPIVSKTTNHRAQISLWFDLILGKVKRYCTFNLVLSSLFLLLITRWLTIPNQSIILGLMTIHYSNDTNGHCEGGSRKYVTLSDFTIHKIMYDALASFTTPSKNCFLRSYGCCMSAIVILILSKLFRELCTLVTKNTETWTLSPPSGLISASLS